MEYFYGIFIWRKCSRRDLWNILMGYLFGEHLEENIFIFSKYKKRIFDLKEKGPFWEYFSCIPFLLSFSLFHPINYFGLQAYQICKQHRLWRCRLKNTQDPGYHTPVGSKLNQPERLLSIKFPSKQETKQQLTCGSQATRAKTSIPP